MCKWLHLTNNHGKLCVVYLLASYYYGLVCFFLQKYFLSTFHFWRVDVSQVHVFFRTHGKRQNTFNHFQNKQHLRVLIETLRNVQVPIKSSNGLKYLQELYCWRIKARSNNLKMSKPKNIHQKMSKLQPLSTYMLTQVLNSSTSRILINSNSTCFELIFLHTEARIIKQKAWLVCSPTWLWYNTCIWTSTFNLAILQDYKVSIKY